MHAHSRTTTGSVLRHSVLAFACVLGGLTGSTGVAATPTQAKPQDPRTQWNQRFEGPEEGIRLAQERASQAGLVVSFIRQDFATFDMGQGQWDLIAGLFVGDLITSHADRIARALKPGGMLIVENFQRDLNRPGAVGGAPLGYEVNELLRAFPMLRIRRYEDTLGLADWSRSGQPVPVVRLVAEKQ